MRTNQKGFTLIEMLVYIAGVVLLVTGIAAALFYMSAWYQKVTVGPRIDQTALTLSARLLGSIRGSAVIYEPFSTFNATSGQLYLYNSATTTAYSDYFKLENGRITYIRNGVAQGFLTPSDVTISALYFTKIVTPKSTGIRFNIDIPVVIKQSSTTRSYTGFAVLRNSYQ